MEKKSLLLISICSTMLEEILKLDFSANFENKVYQLLTGINNIFNADRVVMLTFDGHKEEPKIIEIKKENIPAFFMDNDIKNIIENDHEYITTLKQEGKVLCLDINNLSDDRRVLRDFFKQQNINQLILMTWILENTTFCIIIEDSHNDTLTSESFDIINKFLTFTIKSISYNEVLYQKANIDQLTGLFNRNYYSNIIKKLTKRPIDSLGVIFFDIDNLKEINDTYGHGIGDRQLIVLTKALKTIYKDCDICRIGGDEFVVLMYDYTYEEYLRINKMFYDLLKETSVSCSFGVCYRSGNVDILEMIQLAENDMYYYKRKHHAEVDSDANQSFAAYIQSDIDKERFFMVIQPKIDPYTNKITGAESLARGRARDGQWVSPNVFVPVFEKNQCIDLLDYYMIEQTCILQKRLMEEYNWFLPISVNVSRHTLLLNSFCNDMLSLFAKYDIPHYLIHFEITEKVDVGVEEVLQRCCEMTKHDFIFEIDDFGSHFTNVSFLNEKIFSILKIDRSLVKQICNNELTKGIMRFLIEKCHDNDIKIIAEGVETKEQLDIICELKVDTIQGFYYDEPLSVEDFINKYHCL